MMVFHYENMNISKENQYIQVQYKLFNYVTTRLISWIIPSIAMNSTILSICSASVVIDPNHCASCSDVFDFWFDV